MESSTHAVISERNLAERRLVAIDKAITAHRVEQRRNPYPARAEDLKLYRRVEEILRGRL
jgi:hypothetical protein